MTENRIDSTIPSELATAITDYSVASQQTDGRTGDKENSWITTKWGNYLGYYKQIPELRSVIDAKATWTVGKGFKTDIESQVILEYMKGFGKDSFNTIIENMARTLQINGDSFAEIIRDNETGDLINLKPLDPSVIKIIFDRKGVITKYEQVSKTKDKGSIFFQPEEIFHLVRNRVADEVHGISLIESLEWIILAKNEVQSIIKTLMQRHLKPVMIFHLDTDDPSEIASFRAKNDKAYADGENLYIPKGVVVPELLAVAPNATLNPMPWLEFLNSQFSQSSGVPQIILGGSGEFTEASAKIAYLAFQQTVEEDQLAIEEQLFSQLGLRIEFEFPVSLENELLSDNKKDGAQNIDSSETTAGEGQ